MKIYTLLHETYGWWDNDYNVDIYTFNIDTEFTLTDVE